jgi:hypothetical protein
MIAKVIAWSLRNRFFVGLGTLALVFAGVWPSQGPRLTRFQTFRTCRS